MARIKAKDGTFAVSIIFGLLLIVGATIFTYDQYTARQLLNAQLLRQVAETEAALDLADDYKDRASTEKNRAKRCSEELKNLRILSDSLIVGLSTAQDSISALNRTIGVEKQETSRLEEALEQSLRVSGEVTIARDRFEALANRRQQTVRLLVKQLGARTEERDMLLTAHVWVSSRQQISGGYDRPLPLQLPVVDSLNQYYVTQGSVGEFPQRSAEPVSYKPSVVPISSTPAANQSGQFLKTTSKSTPSVEVDYPGDNTLPALPWPFFFLLALVSFPFSWALYHRVRIGRRQSRRAKRDRKREARSNANGDCSSSDSASDFPIKHL